MQQFDELINTDNIIIDSNISEKEEILKEMASKLICQGYAKSEYIQAVLNREKEYPTGLPTNGVGVAIPHADIKYVIKPAIAVATLKNPIKFNVMGNPDEQVDVRLIFMLAIKEPNEQVNILKKLVNIFQEEHILTRLIEIKNKEEFAEILKSKIRGGER